MNQVVITGFGVVTPIGNNVPAFVESLRQGRVGMSPIAHFETGSNGLPRNAFQVRDFTPPAFAKVHDPFIQYILHAAEEALDSSALDLSRMNRERIGIAVGSSKGGMSTFERFYGRFLRHRSALLAARVYANFLPNIAAQWIARRWSITGPAKPVAVACATGLYAAMEGIRMIEQDEADVCIAGSGDASVTQLMLAAYRQMGVLSKGPMRPFDRARDGFSMGEGAGIVILEKKEFALARGAVIYGEIAGHAYGFELTHPIAFSLDGSGLLRCLKKLVCEAGISPREIDYLNLHGTATRQGDLYETRQIKAAFGASAYQISMSSTKSLFGHMLGASGAVEIIACLVAMRDGFIPPTANLVEPDPECDLNYTPNAALEKSVRTACSISMGFGGHLGAILIRK